MADLRTKLFTLASVATMFAGMAHAQLNGPGVACTAAAGAVFVAAEGTTEQVADTVINCGAQGNASATSVNLSVYLSPAVTVTSATLGSGGGARSEAMAGITGSYTVGGATNAAVVAGTVSGSSVTFNNIVIPANAAVSFTITNIKINASQIATSSGAPTAVTETIFIGGTNVTPGVLPAVNVAFATNALSGVKTSQLAGTSIPGIQICTGSQAWGGAGAAGGFNLQFSEGFATAFKIGGTAAANGGLGSEFGTNTYTGYGVVAPAANTATSGTRIQITFNNVPAGVTVYVPLTVSILNAAVPPAPTSTIQLTSSATGVFSAVTGSTANGAPGATAGNKPGDGSYAAVTLSNGSGTAVYEETLNNSGAVETYTLPVFLSASAAAVTAPSSAITATVSLAPIGSSSSVPNFVSGSSTATASGNAFTACTTTLLFPFVTNQLGFDTGLAISNTSSDLLNGGTKSNAANQSGTCALTFFGNTAPAAVTTATVASGTTYAAAASSVAPGFQGYMIANCNFLYGHGFAYVVYNLTQNNGAAMGYLADVINSDRKQTGTDAGISNTNPESSGN